MSKCYMCIYCKQIYNSTFSEIVTHLIEFHPEETLKFSIKEENNTRVNNFKIIPEICRQQGRTISINESSNTIHISRCNNVVKDSPCGKVTKSSDNDVVANVEAVNETGEADLYLDDKDNEHSEIISLLPSVVEQLKKAGKLTEFILFHKLIKDRTFPLDNIAFLLFLDVVRWFGTGDGIHNMRYSNEIKLFWKTGLRLFHGRFLRFMGGPKCTGGNADSGSFSSKINFIVPDRKMLEDEKKFVDEKSPGIMNAMIASLAACDPDHTKTYKLCVDGKKINPCSKGEIDLWGYEDSPTFRERQSRLTSELNYVRELKELLQKLLSFDHCAVLSCSEHDKKHILDGCRKTVTILSERICDLRKLKVKKVLFLKKLQDKCETDWKNSQFSMVISSIKTTIYQIENTIEVLVNCNDSLCTYAALIKNAGSNFKTEKIVSLNKQGNMVCLTGNCLYTPSLIKQRSDAWFSERKKSTVTGSSINIAIGLDGLKKQREHLLIKAGELPEKEIPSELQKKFDHGSKNELNAVATLVSKYLPAFAPNLSFYEEGCYIEKEGDKTVLVVSPDGSLRTKSDEKPIYGVEIKCPFPDKTFTTPVHYGIPHYYVCQVLSEMNSLGVDKLLFLSFSDQSMTVMEVSFDTNLWEKIYNIIQTVDYKCIPKVTNPNIPDIRYSIKEFCQSNVRLVAELPSCTAIPCQHSSFNNSDMRIYHEECINLTQCNLHLDEIVRTFIKCEDVISECHKICTLRATEVLIFMLADLDRTYKAEMPHACPVAFAFKGYSMRAEQMRKMLQDVLESLFRYGIYCPVISYDGQWAKLAFHDENEEPLTILELQKKHFCEIQTRNAKSLHDEIFATGLVKVTSFLEVTENLYFQRNKSGIVIGLKDGQKLYRMSSNLLSYLHTCKREKKTTKTNDSDEIGNFNVNQALSNLPTSAMASIDNAAVESLSSLEQEHCTSSARRVNIVNDLEYDRLYEQDNENLFDETMVVSNEKSDILQVETSGEQTEPCVENFALESNDVADMHMRETLSNIETVDSENIINRDCLLKIFQYVQKRQEWSKKYPQTFEEFQRLMCNRDLMSKLTKKVILLCYDVFKEENANTPLHICKSWAKPKIVDMMVEATTSARISPPIKAKKKKQPETLVNLCRKVVRSLPKKFLNAAVAENKFQEKVASWRMQSCFQTPTFVDGIGEVIWFSRPEYNPSTLSYLFSFLDTHHLLTNCRVKVCKDGFPERGVKKEAWLEVAKNNNTNLKISHVEDLVDKQSDSIAMATFSLSVETEMERLGHKKEAAFCRIMREFHESEDSPGIPAIERCRRRLVLRNWLLDGVSLLSFPPYGTHIRGVPNIMFQGYLTNIDRRIQIYPYVKSGRFNVRSLGSLEAENFFGEFQDLDPKGSGVIKAEDIPSAIESACQMNHTRLMPSRPFFLNTSQAKVYPVNALQHTDERMEVDVPYIYPSIVHKISVRDHIFDSIERAKRKPKRRLVTIAKPDEAARGVAPVRQHHKCDESKILAHKRLGIEID